MKCGGFPPLFTAEACFRTCASPGRDGLIYTAISKNTWVQWVYHWDATPGTHILRVRATDANGLTQTGTVHRPAPDGVTGHHTIVVDER